VNRKDHLARHHVRHRDAGPESRIRLDGAVDRAVAAGGPGCHEQCGSGDTEPRLLALDVAATGAGVDSCLQAGCVLCGAAVSLGRIDRRGTRHEHDQHRGVECPSLTASADHLAEREGERRRDQQHQQDLDEV